MLDLTEQKFQSILFAMPDHGDGSSGSDDDSGRGDETPPSTE
jgi:hypothetical protein